MEIGRLSGPHAAAEDRTIFGWYVITSSPLYLGHNISDDSISDRIWPIVSNMEAIAINQDWQGHPGRLVKTWDPAPDGRPWPFGRGVYAVPCDTLDVTQHGWTWNYSSLLLKGPNGKCLDWQAADNRQFWVVDCNISSYSQRWRWDSQDLTAFGLLHDQHGRNLTIPGRQNSVGFAQKGTPSAVFRLKDGLLQFKNQNSTGCVAARAVNPVPKHSTFELWSKPTAGAMAILLVNNGLNNTLSFALDEIGLSTSVKVRDVWAHIDVGTLAPGNKHSVSLGVHDSALLLLQPITSVTDVLCSATVTSHLTVDPSKASSSTNYQTLSAALDAIKTLPTPKNVSVLISAPSAGNSTTIRLNQSVALSLAHSCVTIVGAPTSGDHIRCDKQVPTAMVLPVTDTATLARLQPTTKGHVYSIDLDAMNVSHAVEWPLNYNVGDVTTHTFRLYYDDELLDMARYPKPTMNTSDEFPFINCEGKGTSTLKILCPLTTP